MQTLAEHTPEELIGPLNEVEKKHAPARLFTTGRIELLRDGLRVSVVGSRDATTEGLGRARALSEILVSRGVVVVSGLAEGSSANEPIQISSLILKSSGVEALDEAAVKGVSRLKFTPAKDSAGKAVAWCPPTYPEYTMQLVWQLPK